MIFNVANALIGLWLVYASVLDFAKLEASGFTLVIAGLVILVLAMWARGSDHAKWHSSADIVMGLVLAMTGIGQLALSLGAMTFWLAFWIGMAVAIISLWAALYRPRAAEAKR